MSGSSQEKVLKHREHREHREGQRLNAVVGSAFVWLFSVFSVLSVVKELDLDLEFDLDLDWACVT